MKKWKKTLLIIFMIPVMLVLLYPAYITPKILITNDMSAMEGAKFAHRGYFDNASEAPENSLLSFQYAIDNGYGIELDVQLSSDGVPMVFHDADLERVCGVEGKIWDYTCAELQQMHLLGAKTACWTLRSQENYESVKGQFDFYIFDSFQLVP